MKVKRFMYVSVLIFELILLTGCSLLNKNKTSINDKVSTEIEYIDNELITLANQLNNISYQKYSVKVQKEENDKEGQDTGNSNGRAGTKRRIKR